MRLVTARQMSLMDKKTIEEFGLPGMVLMENAGRGATRILLSKFGHLKNRKVGILAGAGNNGGDGFVVARYLAGNGIDVSVYLFAAVSKPKGDAAVNLSLLSDLKIPVIEILDEKALAGHKAEMTGCDIWVDALFGTGLNAPVSGVIKTAIDLINILKKPVLAIDIPSGLHPDTGVPLGACIRANVTATFGYAKTGHFTYPGIDYCGSIEIVDIGIPPHIAEAEKPAARLLTPEIISSCYRPRSTNAHKGTTGHLLVFAGTKGKTGAAALTAEAAMRSGAGLVTLGVPESVNPILEMLLTEAMTVPLPETQDKVLSNEATGILLHTMNGKACLAIGPGIGTDKQTADVFNELMCESTIPVVIDADGLNLLGDNLTLLTNIKTPAVLTPHPKEMARLTGESVAAIQNNRINSARAFAETYKVHLVLKGARTVIAHPDGTVYINPTGNPAMASGGMGDVLTGMIAGFITQGYSPAEASHMGVYLHGTAADILSAETGPAGILASDIIRAIPHTLALMAEKKLAPVNDLGEWF